jgi:hypothetical protein
MLLLSLAGSIVPPACPKLLRSKSMGRQSPFLKKRLCARILWQQQKVYLTSALAVYKIALRIVYSLKFTLSQDFFLISHYCQEKSVFTEDYIF